MRKRRTSDDRRSEKGREKRSGGERGETGGDGRREMK